MRSGLRNATAASALALVSLAWSGCDAKKQTEYVTGVSTQMNVPKDIASVVVSVSVGGVNTFCRAYQVYNQKVLLPRSLGEFPASGSGGGEPITVAVIGLTDVATDQSNNAYVSDCSFTQQKVGADSARILRRSRQPYVTDQILFLPMPLRYACMDNDCPDPDQTCKAGRCVPMDQDPKFLPAYRDDLLDGTGAACFSASQCFVAAVPPVTVNADDCTYAIPNTASAPAALPGAPPNPIMSSGAGVNVEVVWDGGLSTEVLDLDPDEGFSIPDATKPQRFRLTPGLCDLVKGFDQQGKPTQHQITAIRATGLCQAKGKFQPLCADDQNNAMGAPGGISPDPGLTACAPTPLTKSKSVLLVLADDSANNSIFYNANNGGAGDVALSPVISEALKTPAFKNTQVGLTFYPGASTIGTCGPHPQAIAPELARDPSNPAKGAQLDIANAFNNLGDNPSLFKPVGTPLKLGGALIDAYAQLHSVTGANRRAVFVIGNRGFDDTTCTDSPANLAKTAFMTDNIITYAAAFARDSTVDRSMTPALPGLNELAQAGDDPAKMPVAYDTRNRTSADQQQIAQSALEKLVDDLGTCAYDIDTTRYTLPADSALLAYSDPLGSGANIHRAISHAAAGTCAGNDGTGDGWNLVTASDGAKRIFVCGPSCTNYRTTLKNAAAYAALYGQQGPDIPLYAYTPACAPK